MQGSCRISIRRSSEGTGDGWCTSRRRSGGLKQRIFLLISIFMISDDLKEEQRRTSTSADYVVKMEAAPSDLSGGFSSSAPPPSKSSCTEAPISANNSSTKIAPPLPPRLPPHIGIRTLNHIFTYEELVAATEQFAETNLLGEGGFGYVHKGVLPDGREVAVKQLKPRSWQGETEFQAELDVISRVHHRNLVSLIGYCIHDEKRLLVYEFLPNNTLDFHLHEKGPQYLDWSMRMRIAIGSAKGLAYLHQDCDPKIIHRDVKAANILLNHAFEAKVADFGLAKFFPDEHTHVTTRILGTLGYLAPEYASSGKLTEKSDVFSYGIILLELITGQRPTSVTCDPTGDGLLDWSRPLLVDALEKDDYKSLTDPRLEGNYDHNEMKRMVTCAAACVRQSSRLRPRINEVVRVLEGAVTLQDLNAGISSG